MNKKILLLLILAVMLPALASRPQTLENAWTVVQATGRVDVYAEASSGSESRGHVESGCAGLAFYDPTRATGKEKTSDWYFVNFLSSRSGRVTGYCKPEHLKELRRDGMQLALVNDENPTLNLRASRSTASQVVRSLQKGDLVMTLWDDPYGQEWFHVLTWDGQEGWVVAPRLETISNRM